MNSVLLAGIDIAEAFAKEQVARDKVKRADAILDFGEFAKAFHFGTAVTILPDGSLLPELIFVDIEKLKICLDDYATNFGGPKLDVNDIVKRLNSGDIFDENGKMHEDLRSYKAWHSTFSSDTKQGVAIDG